LPKYEINCLYWDHAMYLQVLHISDVHIDSEYAVSSNAECNEPLCCRDGAATSLAPPTDRGKRTTTIHAPSGKWGDYRNCDLPWWTLENLLRSITEKVDYVLWTGDQQAHDVWSQSKQGSLDTLYNLTDLFVRAVPTLPIYPALGNHDIYPANNFPPKKVPTEGKYDPTWFYQALAKAWSPWLPEDALEVCGFKAELAWRSIPRQKNRFLLLTHFWINFYSIGFIWVMRKSWTFYGAEALQVT